MSFYLGLTCGIGQLDIRIPGGHTNKDLSWQQYTRIDTHNRCARYPNQPRPGVECRAFLWEHLRTESRISVPKLQSRRSRSCGSIVSSTPPETQSRKLSAFAVRSGLARSSELAERNQSDQMARPFVWALLLPKRAYALSSSGLR